MDNLVNFNDFLSDPKLVEKSQIENFVIYSNFSAASQLFVMRLDRGSVFDGVTRIGGDVSSLGPNPENQSFVAINFQENISYGAFARFTNTSDSETVSPFFVVRIGNVPRCLKTNQFIEAGRSQDIIRTEIIRFEPQDINIGGMDGFGVTTTRQVVPPRPPFLSCL